MPLEISYRKQFEKELKKQKKRGKDLEKIKVVIKIIANQQELPPKYRNHRLVGNFKDHWECHFEPDWLLVYKKTDTEVVFERTGSHSDLFK